VNIVLLLKDVKPNMVIVLQIDVVDYGVLVPKVNVVAKMVIVVPHITTVIIPKDAKKDMESVIGDVV